MTTITGDRVRALRKRRGWTQEEFGARCGLRRTEINRIERGKNKATSYETRTALAKGFELSAQSLNAYLDGSISLNDAAGAMGETRLTGGTIEAGAINNFEMAVARWGDRIWPEVIAEEREKAAGIEDDRPDFAWSMILGRAQEAAERKRARVAPEGSTAKPRTRRDPVPARKVG